MALAVLTEKVVSLSETQNPDLMSSLCLAFWKQQHCLPFYLQPLFKLAINTSISVYSIRNFSDAVASSGSAARARQECGLHVAGK